MSVDGGVGAGEDDVVDARGAVDELGHEEPLVEETGEVARVRRAAGVGERGRVERETLVNQRGRGGGGRELEEGEAAGEVVADFVESVCVLGVGLGGLVGLLLLIVSYHHY